MNLDYKVKKLKAKWPKSLTRKTVTIVNNNYGLKDEILLSLVKYDIQVAKKVSYTACSLGKLWIACSSPRVTLTSPPKIFD